MAIEEFDETQYVKPISSRASSGYKARRRNAQRAEVELRDASVAGPSTDRADDTSGRPRRSEQSSALDWAVVAWLVVTLIRPQDIFPLLRVIYPGVICNVTVLFCLFSRIRSANWRDSILRWYLLFLTVTTLGVFVAVNTFWLFHYFKEVVVYGLVLMIALPIVMRTDDGRRKICGVLALSGVVTAVWGILHRGHGQGAWLGDENDVALWLNISLCISYFLSTAEKNLFVRWFYRATALICVVAVIFSFSRGGFVGLVIAISAIALFSGRIAKVAIVVTLLAVIAFPILATLHPPEGRGKSRTYLEEISSIDDQKDATRLARLYTWTGGWVMFKDNPILGIGAGNFGFRLSGYESDPALTKINSFNKSFGGKAAHSTYFQLLSELGVFGTLAFLGIYFLTLQRSWNSSRENRGSRLGALAAGVGSGLISYTITAAFISTLYYPAFWLLAALSIPAAAHRLTLAGKRDHSSRSGV